MGNEVSLLSAVPEPSEIVTIEDAIMMLDYWKLDDEPWELWWFGGLPECLDPHLGKKGLRSYLQVVKTRHRGIYQVTNHDESPVSTSVDREELRKILEVATQYTVRDNIGRKVKLGM